MADSFEVEKLKFAMVLRAEFMIAECAKAYGP